MSEDDFFAPGAKRFAAAGVRENNQRAVLMAIALNENPSGAQIARITGLGPQSVSRILLDLEADGLVTRGEVHRGLRGKPATPIMMNPDGAYAIGCEIGWRHYTVVLRNFTGAILGEHRGDFEFLDPNQLVGEVASLVRLLLQIVPANQRHRVVGLGVAMPSGIDRNIHLLGANAGIAESWRQMDVVSRLEEELNLDTIPINDGAAGCWGELVALPVPRPQNLAYLFIGTFVGAGLIAEGRLWQGPTGNSANLGSMLVTDETGKNQFVHLIASIFALQQRLKAAGMPVPTGDPGQWDWDSLDPVLTQWLEASAKALAKVIANSSAVCELSTAIVDSVMPAPLTERLVRLIRERLDDLPTLTFDHPQVIKGKLGHRGAAIGAALKPLYRKLFSREFDDVMRTSDQRPARQ